MNLCISCGNPHIENKEKMLCATCNKLEQDDCWINNKCMGTLKCDSKQVAILKSTDSVGTPLELEKELAFDLVIQVKDLLKKHPNPYVAVDEILKKYNISSK